MGQNLSFHWGVLLVVSLATFILVIDTTIMEVSISALVNDLNIQFSTIQSIITISTLIKAAFMLTGAKLQDLIGRKRTFMVGAAIYGVGTILAVFSQDAAMFLMGWSILEGIGTVMILPATTTFMKFFSSSFLCSSE